MTSVTLDEIVFDDSIYPRTAWSQATVDRYADALQADEVFPPIVLEAGTKRLLDGMHRTEAHRAVGRHFISVDFHEIPDGVPAKLYAASLSSRHGDPLDAEDKRQVARETATSNPDFSMVLIAKLLGTTRQTVSRYVGDLVEHRREVRKAKAQLLHRAGWTNVAIADELHVSEGSIRSDVNADISTSEDLIRDAAAELPVDDADALVAALLAQPTPPTPGPVDADGAPPADPGTTPAAARQPSAEQTAQLPDAVLTVLAAADHDLGLTADQIWARLPMHSVHSSWVPPVLDELAATGRVLVTGEGRHGAKWVLTPGPGEVPAPAGSGSTSPAPEPEPPTCLGTDMDCGRPLPCPNHPRTAEERIAAVAEVAPEFVQPAPAEPAPTLRIEPTADEKQRAVQRDARALLLRVVELLSPTGGKPDYIETWARKLGPYDDELAALVQRAGAAMAALDDLISEAGK